MYGQLYLANHTITFADSLNNVKEHKHNHNHNHNHIHDYEEQSASGLKRAKRRSQATRACLNCKRLHAKCDDERPCRRCVQSGTISSCIDVPRKRTKKPNTNEQLPIVSPTKSWKEDGKKSPTSLDHVVDVPKGHTRTYLKTDDEVLLYPPDWDEQSNELNFNAFVLQRKLPHPSKSMFSTMRLPELGTSNITYMGGKKEVSESSSSNSNDERDCLFVPSDGVKSPGIIFPPVDKMLWDNFPSPTLSRSSYIEDKSALDVVDKIKDKAKMFSSGGSPNPLSPLPLY